MTALTVTATQAATPWYVWFVFTAGCLLMLGVIIAAHLKDPINREHSGTFPAVMIERERDGDVTGQINADLPTAQPMTEMTDE
jgi:hypothetical protein